MSNELTHAIAGYVIIAMIPLLLACGAAMFCILGILIRELRGK